MPSYISYECLFLVYFWACLGECQRLCLGKWQELCLGKRLWLILVLRFAVLVSWHCIVAGFEGLALVP